MTKLTYAMPVQPFPVQFKVTIRDVVYVFATQYRETPEGGWLLDIFGVDQQPQARGLPLVAGLDLLYQFNHLALGFALVVLCLDGRTTPTYESLGVEDRLVLVMEI